MTYPSLQPQLCKKNIKKWIKAHFPSDLDFGQSNKNDSKDLFDMHLGKFHTSCFVIIGVVIEII